ncbi:MAG: hypothetical protein HY301_01595, partial [Verrucomicrobia bacterium]|nr:hypothetical protein [Verrucomicrobiota bacterium]
NARAGTVTQDVFFGAWLLTNSYVVGQSNNSTSTVTHISGVLRVTNSAGTARFVIGQGGKGTYNLRGGSVEADGLFVTNNGAGSNNSIFNFDFGTLITHTNSKIVYNSNFTVGNVTNTSSTWQILGGTFELTNGNNSVLIGNNTNATVQVTVSGANTLWTNSGSLSLGSFSDNNLLTVSGGAEVAAANIVVGDLSGSTSNRVVVDGSGSALRTPGTLTLGDAGSDNVLILTNGGRAFTGGGIVGNSGTASNSLAIITGAGSLWSNSGSFNLGNISTNNTLLISNGGGLVSGSVQIGINTAGDNNRAVITGAGSGWTNTGASFSVGVSGSANRILVESNGALVTGGLTISSGSLGSNNSVTVTSGGSVTVTNGVLNVGLGNVGTLGINGGSVTADILRATNNTASLTNSILGLTNGSLTLQGSQIATTFNQRFDLGTGAGNFFTLNLEGGTHTITGTGGTGVLPVRIGANSGTGAVNVAGVSALWNVLTNLEVGSGGRGTLNLSNGATVSVKAVSIGLGSGLGVVNVTGAGSTLGTTNVSLEVGSFTVGNQLNVTAGGQVNSAGLSLGQNSGANSNLVLVSGAGSGLSNSGTLFVGRNGATNVLQVVSNGAVVTAGLTISGFAGASNNAVLVSGGALTATNAAHTTSLNVGQLDRGFLTLSGGTILADQLVVTNVGAGVTNSIFNFNHGTLTTLSNSAIVAAGNFLIGQTAGTNAEWRINGGLNSVRTLGGDTILGNAAGTAGRVIVDGAATVWSNSGGVTVGFNGSNSLVLVTNGGAVFSSNATLSLNATASGNSAIITGAGSVWSNLTTFSVGGSGSGSNGQLQVLAGGLLASVNVSVGVSGSGHSAIVDGPGSRVTNQSQLTVGNTGSGGQLLITNGGVVDTLSLLMGGSAASSNHLLTVTGGGSALRVGAGGPVIGGPGGLNQFTVAGGGAFFSAGVATLGNASVSNVALVTGAGSLWSNAASFTVGASSFGNGNRLLVSNGATVITAVATVGSSGASNSAAVDGTGSLWTNSGTLTVGAIGAGNVLVVSNSGQVAAGDLVIGSQTGATNNQVIVAGGSLTGTNAAGALNDLVVGRDGGGSLTLNGGIILTSKLTVTNNGPGFTNSSFIFNHGTLTTLSNSTIVAPSGTFVIGLTPGQTATWLVLGGSNRVATNVDVGGNLNAIGRLIVSGPGTFWTNAGSIRVGFGTRDNQLLVSNGANFFTSGGITVGTGNSFAVSNLLVVTGAGTRVTTDALDVGTFGTNNRAVISAGGFVSSPSGGTISAGGGASNSVLVTGPGSLWTNGGNLLVGNGANNQFTIADGGQAFVAGAINVGTSATGSNNAVLVTGAGSLLSNLSGILIGGSGSGNRLTVESNGVVTSGGYTLGASAGSLNNVLTVDGGALRGTNVNGETTTLTVGQNGQGTLNLLAGSVTANQLRVTNGGSSVFNFSGGTLNVRTTQVNNAQTFFVGNGTNVALMNLLGTNGHVFSNGLVVRSNATLAGNGTIFGALTNFGTLGPGASPGSLRIEGSLRLGASSTMTFELGGLIATNEYDQVVVTNFVQFAGTLSLSLINNFLPAPGDAFTLVKFNTSSGIFNNAVNGGRVNLANNLASFHVSYDNNLVLNGAQYVDTDGDGQGDLQEIAAGTDPNNPGSSLRILSITLNGGGQIALQFQSVGGKNYTVEFSNDLAVWNPVNGATFTNPSAGVSQFVDTGTLTGGLGVTARNYRIRLAP